MYNNINITVLLSTQENTQAKLFEYKQNIIVQATKKRLAFWFCFLQYTAFSWTLQWSVNKLLSRANWKVRIHAKKKNMIQYASKINKVTWKKAAKEQIA